MKLGLVIPVYLYDQQRYNWAKASLQSLSRTIIPGKTPVVLFVIKSTKPPYDTEHMVKTEWLPFECKYMEQPLDAKSIDACNVFGWDHLIQLSPDVTHLAMATCDWLWNKDWLIELESLIARHPKAKAWWVYRSAHEKYHKTLRIENDVLVRSMNAGGCFTVEEYKSLGLKYSDCRLDAPRVYDATYNENTGNLWYRLADGREITVPRGTSGPKALQVINHGLTLDLYDPWARQGERWVTKRSYILNMGLRGINQQPDAPEYAIDFVGIDEEEPDDILRKSKFTDVQLPHPRFELEEILEALEGYELTISLKRKK